MANISRRDAFKFGGISMAGIAAALMGGCGQPPADDSTAASTETSATATSSANRKLEIDKKTGLLSRSEFLGLDTEIELANGTMQAAINFDNGATTPSLLCCMEEIQAQLPYIPGVTLFADSEDISDRVGVLTFNIDGVDAVDVAEKLAGNWGIAVRQGEFCAHPLCHRLMGVSDEEILATRDNPDFSAPAMVRVSMGMYNSEEDVDTLIEAVTDIARG